MPWLRAYGAICPGCKKPFPLGVVDLPPNAQLGDLEYELSEQDWKPGFRACPDPKCNASV